MSEYHASTLRDERHATVSTLFTANYKVSTGISDSNLIHKTEIVGNY